MLAQPCSVTKHFCISPSISLHQFSMAGRAQAVRIAGYKCNMRGCSKQCREHFSLAQHLWTGHGIEDEDVKPCHWKEITEGSEEDGSDPSDEVRPVPTSHKRPRWKPGAWLQREVPGTKRGQTMQPGLPWTKEFGCSEGLLEPRETTQRGASWTDRDTMAGICLGFRDRKIQHGLWPIDSLMKTKPHRELLRSHTIPEHPCHSNNICITLASSYYTFTVTCVLLNHLCVYLASFSFL